MRKFVFLFSLLLLILCGCNQSGLNNGEIRHLGNNAAVDQTKADKAKNIILAMEEVTDVRGATVGEDIYVAVKVKQFDRLRLDHIRKEATKKVKKRYPDDKVHISTDKKLFLELDKIENKLQQDGLDEKKLKKELNALEDKMKG